MPKWNKHQRGFTLIEILVALTVFAVLSALSYRSLTALLQTRERIQAETLRWREVMLFFNRLDYDFRQFAPRSVSSPTGSKPAWSADSEPTPWLHFSRLGDSALSGELANTQRIGYQLTGQQIEFLIWPESENIAISPVRYPVLKQVRALNIRYMQTHTHQWFTNWPLNTEDISSHPKAVEVTVVLSSGERLQRIYAL